MSTPTEPGASSPPSFLGNFIRTLLWMLVCGIVGPIFLFIYFASGSSHLIGWMLWTGLAVTILDVVLAFVIAARRTAGQAKLYRLSRTGRRAYAHVLSAEETGVQVNDQPMIVLRVRIEGHDVAPFEEERRLVISGLHLPLLSAGPVPVLVDPEAREWEFDWDAALSAPGAPVPPLGRPPADGRPAAERLAELDDLLQRDLISREEYDDTRARILGGL